MRDRLPELTRQFNDMGYEVYPISAATGHGVKELMRAVAARLRQLPRPLEDVEPEAEEEVVVRPRHTASEEAHFEVAQESKRRYRVSGPRIERLVAMTDMNNPFALERLQKEMEKMGVTQSLRDAGVEAGDMVTIGRNELEWSDEPWVRFEQSTSRRRRREGPGKQKS